MYLESLEITSYILEIFDSELSTWYSNRDVKLESGHWNLDQGRNLIKNMNLEVVRTLVKFKTHKNLSSILLIFYFKEAKVEARKD